MRPPSSRAGTSARRMSKSRNRTKTTRRGARLRDEHGGPALHGLRVQQRRGALVLHLRQDQGTHQVAQGLDAGGVGAPRLGRRSRGSPAWSSATSANACTRWRSKTPTTCSTSCPALWAYSSAQWLRHTTPTPDTNRGRWESSPFWLAIQQADFYGEAEPAVRERKRQGDVRLLCQMIAGLLFVGRRLPRQRTARDG